MTEGLILLVLAWSGYFALHSLLASLGFKQWVEGRWPALGRRYRLGYNVLATVLLAAPLGLAWALRGPPLWQWSGIGAWASWAVTLVGLAGFAATTRYYDMAAFMGLRGGTGDTDQRLRISPPHRFVRHPWYFFGLLILWSRPMDAAWLVSALCITVYAAVGSHLEDRKLVVLYGEAYRRYRRQVPGLIPLPWRWLDRRGAAELEALADPLSRSAHR